MRNGKTWILSVAVAAFVGASCTPSALEEPKKQYPAVVPEAGPKDSPELGYDADGGRYSRPELTEEFCVLAGCFGAHPVVDTKQMTAKEIAILDDLVAAREPKFQVVTAAWLAAEVRRFNTFRRTDFSEDAVREILRTSVINSRAREWGELKTLLTARSARRLKMGEFLNNEEFDTPLDVLLSGKSQSAGFTAMMHLAARSAWAKEFYRADTPLVVLIAGHAMPGVIRKDKGKDTLFGLETSVTGEGARNFGPIADLAELIEPVRVVDAETFALLEIFGDRIPPGLRQCWMTASLVDTSKRFGFEGESIEARIIGAPRKVETAVDREPVTIARHSGLMNGFSFGRLKKVAGDQRRGAVVVLADPVRKPPVVVAKINLVRNVDELMILLRSDRNSLPLLQMSDDELKAKVASIERKSLTIWRAAKELTNEEKTLPLGAYADLDLTPAVAEELRRFIAARTPTLVPPEAKKASEKVYGAVVALDKVAAAQLKDLSKHHLLDLYVKVASAASTASVEPNPLRRAALVKLAVREALEKAPIGVGAQRALLPALVAVEVSRFEANDSWAPLLAEPPAPKKVETKKDDPKKDDPTPK